MDIGCLYIMATEPNATPCYRLQVGNTATENILSKKFRRTVIITGIHQRRDGSIYYVDQDQKNLKGWHERTLTVRP